MPIPEVSRRFADLLGEVHAAARGGALSLDGQNIFAYRDAAGGEADVEFGVGTTSPFVAIGRVEPSETPGGEIATTTHWGAMAAWEAPTMRSRRGARRTRAN